MKTRLVITVLIIYLAAIVNQAYFTASANNTSDHASIAPLPNNYAAHLVRGTFSIANSKWAGTYACPRTHTGLLMFFSNAGIKASEVRLIRPDENGKNVELKISVHKIQNKEIPDFIIKSGDTFYLVPTKTQKFFSIITLGLYHAK